MELSLFSVKVEIPVTAFTKDQAEEKARMIVGSGRPLPKDSVSVELIGRAL